MGFSPNKIKYSNTPIANAVKAKNFALGINSSATYGPTNTTGYWNGISPPLSGYTIYINKAIQGPSIFRPTNDLEFINLTNYLSSSGFQNINQAISWYSGLTDTICVNMDYPDVVTNGLQFMVDSNFLPSYYRTGNTWIDLSYSGRNSTLINSPSLVLSGKNTFFNFQSASSHYATIPEIGTLSNFTIESWVFFNSLPTINTYPAVMTNTYSSGIYVNYTMGVLNSPWDGKICGGFFNNGWQQTSGFTPTLGQWYHIAVTYDGSLVTQYVDGTIQSTKSTSLSAISTGLGGRLMRRWDDVNYINGHLLNSKIYNRSLSLFEIVQNYYAHSVPIEIITDGLILHLDAGNIVSYPYTGTLWKSTVSTVKNNGTLTNSPSFSLSNGGSIVFDGTNDYVELPSNFFNHDSGSAFSVSIWFKTTTSGGTIFGQQNTTNPSSASGYVPAIYINNTGKIVASCFWGGSVGNNTTSSTSVTDGSWHNIVVTFSSGSQKTYLDNNLIGTISKTQTTYSATYYYFLGAGYSSSWDGSNGYYFNGNISYASFYNLELSSNQINQNYQAISYRYI